MRERKNLRFLSSLSLVPALVLSLSRSCSRSSTHSIAQRQLLESQKYPIAVFSVGVQGGARAHAPTAADH